jgi:hypothetical protein
MTEPFLCRLNRHAGISEESRVPMAKQAPSHVRHAKALRLGWILRVMMLAYCFGRFTLLLGKNQSSGLASGRFARNPRRCSMSALVRWIGRLLLWNFGVWTRVLFTASTIQMHLRWKSTDRRRRPRSSLGLTPVMQSNHTISPFLFIECFDEPPAIAPRMEDLPWVVPVQEGVRPHAPEEGVVGPLGGRRLLPSGDEILCVGVRRPRH